MRGRRRLLLHACCAPCSLEPVKYLREEGFEPTICWTNPNIQPIEEHDKRLKTLLAWADEVAHVPVIVAEDRRDLWEAKVGGSASALWSVQAARRLKASRPEYAQRDRSFRCPLRLRRTQA